MGLPEQPAWKFKHFAGDGAKELVRRCLREAGDETCSRFQEMYPLYRKYFAKYCMYHVEPYEGIRQLLVAAKEQGLKLAVLSNKPHDQAVHVVGQIFGQEIFDYVQGQTDTIPKKPDPTGAKAIASQFGVDPSSCIYVGDTNTDMDTGKAAGMFTVGVLWGFRDREELEAHHADGIVSHPMEILQYLEEMK
jgi:phosphoglycolate phosphatase